MNVKKFEGYFIQFILLIFFYICTRMKVYDNQCVILKALRVGKTKTF